MERKENGIFITDEELMSGLIAIAGVGLGVITWKMLRCIVSAPAGC